MAETKGTIVCRLCGDHIAVVFTRVNANRVTVEVADTQPLATHYATCRAMAAPAALTVPKGELAGRVDRLLGILEHDGHLTRGPRTCTMCGATNEACLAGTDQRTNRLLRKRKPGTACCPACDEGNTHPTGGERTPCAEWALEHGAKD